MLFFFSSGIIIKPPLLFEVSLLLVEVPGGVQHNFRVKKAAQLKKDSRKKKFELIDQFIENNPKIIPKEKNTPVIPIEDSVKIDKNELMTETLAKVYLEQKKFKKAIQAYKILSLKYPEKSSSFADRIKIVEKIQSENR